MNKTKLVLLVVLDAAVVGAALHVHQLALGGRVHLHKTTWSSDGEGMETKRRKRMRKETRKKEVDSSTWMATRGEW